MGSLIFILVIVALIMLWPLIRRWLMRLMLRRAENYMRRAAGMPPRSRQNHRRKQDSDGNDETHHRRRTRSPRHEGPIIPREYAVDVEYEEFRSYSDTTTIGDRPSGRRRTSSFRSESQVEDVEYVEIKSSRKR